MDVDPCAQLFPNSHNPVIASQQSAGEESATTTAADRRVTPVQVQTPAQKLDALVEQSDLLSLGTPAVAVSQFIKTVCRRVFPIAAVWGTRHNLNAFLSAVDAYVQLGRYESFTLEQAVRGIRVTDLPWLNDALLLPVLPTGAADRGSSGKGSGEQYSAVARGAVDKPFSRNPDDDAANAAVAEEMATETQQSEETLIDSQQCPMDCDNGTEADEAPAADSATASQEAAAETIDEPHEKKTKKNAKAKLSKCTSLARQQLFYRFMQWVYSDFINSLLSVCFYATEVEGRGSDVHYYRKPLWARIVRRGKMQLFNNFMPVSKQVQSSVNLLNITTYFLFCHILRNNLPCSWFATRKLTFHLPRRCQTLLLPLLYLRCLLHNKRCIRQGLLDWR